MATTYNPFSARHIGPQGTELQEMLDFLGYSSAEELAQAALPDSIAQTQATDLPEPLSEQDTLSALWEYATRNELKKQLIGNGYYDTITPTVITRNIVENPAWYTAYTPYQPEISQGRLEALLNFQTLVQDLTGLPVAGASLLDEATAVAEAVQLMARGNAKAHKAGGVVLLDQQLLEQSIAVTTTRAQAVGINVEVIDLDNHADLTAYDNIIGAVISYPGSTGQVRDITPIVHAIKEAHGLVTVACDLLAQMLLKSPGELGADIAVGSAQRFGVPLFFGGPHAAFISCQESLQRKLPGRIVGVSVDAEGKPAYRLALQTREQHIRRDKATSNICTAQALLAVIAGMYAVWHGPEGLKKIAEAIHGRAVALAVGLSSAGMELHHDAFFDTVTVRVENADAVLKVASDQGFNLRKVDDTTVGISVGESTTDADIEQLLGIVAHRTTRVNTSEFNVAAGPLADWLRTDAVLSHPIFNRIKSETQMMRYMRQLADYDLALDRTMIPLGSCTMKLNAAVSMEPITWPEFASIHPHAPREQVQGWLDLIEDVEQRLAAITGYAKVSVQPNAGSQGEFAGLLAIARYHQSRGEEHRDIVLIPASAHGTNAASAALAGLKVVAVKNAVDGSIDLEDLEAKLSQYGERTAAIMITYPSTHGVYEEHVREVCDKVHAAGGQVYIDGANLNALVGLAQPGDFGGDVSHLNLHKTFTIPHGGGGPGVGPVCVAEHLIEFMPSPEYPVSAADYGSAGVLPITWSYIALMGAEGLKKASEVALVNANYISRKLQDYFPTLYTGAQGLVAHECIVDLRALTKASGITAEDVSKRLMDYGFHAPTLAFPVPGTLMVEPTESEDKGELDRFIDAMISIHGEIQEVISGEVSAEDSVLRQAPFTAASLLVENFDHPFSREKAAQNTAYFPPVRRIDNAYGDRNLVCSCPPLESFLEENHAE